MDRPALKLALIAGALVSAAAVAATAQPKGPLAYDAKGGLISPADYREWVFLSAGLDMTYGPAAPPAGVHRFDNVFVDPAAYQAFKRTGAWPDRTVMVLEIRNAAQDVSINKAGHVQTDVAAIELHVKDQAKGGWGFYSVSPQGETRKIPANSACDSCHGLSGAVDTTFVQFYPTLVEAAKKAGTLKQAAKP